MLESDNGNFNYRKKRRYMGFLRKYFMIFWIIGRDYKVNESFLLCTLILRVLILFFLDRGVV